MLNDTRQRLRGLNVSPEEIAEVEGLWHETVEFDYAQWATGGSRVPEGLPQVKIGEWKTLREGGVE
ncbi:MAG: hypothetical protein QGF53_16240, partial [Alphaproteobacteria bacterium]|nr:hypothetical protein [Alphaproteobacteria bacterium]